MKRSQKPGAQVRIVRWSPSRSRPPVEAFLRRPAVAAAAERVAARILTDVRSGGDRALLHYIRRFDGARLTASRLRVAEAEWDAACGQVDPGFRRAARMALARIRRFARAGLRADWTMCLPDGTRMGERYVPLDRVGIYVPGGVAPLASTVLMTAPLARAANVRTVILCTPADARGRVDPHILYAARLAGVDAVYRAGGIQAIAAMAYGTRTIRPVQKIVGPGGPFVTAAKRLVYGTVALDMVAGPSEIAILADGHADPEMVAADLLAQIEHGTGQERALLVTDDEGLARQVRRALWRQVDQLPRAAALRRVLASGVLLVVVEDLEHGLLLCNRFAPEHLEVLTRRPRKWAGRVRAAGAVFVGAWTPESAGDYAAGPSHVLPTGGTAAFFSGLNAEDFRRRSNFLELRRDSLRALLPTIEALGRVEGLTAHVRSARLRCMPGRGRRRAESRP